MKPTILIADDDPAGRKVIESVLLNQGYELVFAVNGREVLKKAAENIRKLKLPTYILLLSMYSDEGLIYQALQSGVKGYVLKTSVSDELLWAVRAVATGKTYLSSQVSEIMVENAVNPRAPGQDHDPLSNISPREKEILQLIAEEHTSSEIARLLFISEKTVEKHRASLMEKLNVRNLAGLVRLAVKHRLVDPDS